MTREAKEVTALTPLCHTLATYTHVSPNYVFNRVQYIFFPDARSGPERAASPPQRLVPSRALAAPSSPSPAPPPSPDAPRECREAGAYVLLPDHRRVGAGPRRRRPGAARVVVPPASNAGALSMATASLATFAILSCLSIESYFAARGAAGRILIPSADRRDASNAGVAGRRASRPSRRDIPAPAAGRDGTRGTRGTPPAAPRRRRRALSAKASWPVNASSSPARPRRAPSRRQATRRSEMPRGDSAASGRAVGPGSRGFPARNRRTRTRSRASTGPRPPTARSRRSRDPCYARDAVCGSRQRHVC